jgi:hypothetical protein
LETREKGRGAILETREKGEWGDMGNQIEGERTDIGNQRGESDDGKPERSGEGRYGRVQVPITR